MFRILIAVLFVFLQETLPAAGKEMGSFSVPGGWEGHAYGDDKASRFTHCVAEASYKSGTVLMVFVTRNWTWSLAFVNPKWTLQERENVRISYRFDSGAWLEETGTGVQENGIVVAMPSEANLVTLFRKARVMEILVPEGRYGFELGGSSRMMAALGDCVKGYLDREEHTTASTTNSPKSTKEGETKHSSSSGTGILISQSGHVLTNNHVIDGCKSLKVTQTGDIARSAQVLRTDANNDLAVLKVAQIYNANDIAKFRIGRSVKAGETVAVYGYPLAGTLSVSGNIVSGNVTSLAGLADDVRFFQISAPVQPGNSGGPLLDASGLIIGVVNAQINEIAVAQVTGSIPQNVNFAIKGITAMTFLEANSIAFETSSDSTTKPLTDIAEAAKRFSVLITCQ
jgi:hypothetical protein